MPNDNLRINNVELEDTTYDIEALHFVSEGFADTPDEWKAKIESILGFEVIQDSKRSGQNLPATSPSADTLGKLYIVQIDEESLADKYVEFVTYHNTTEDTYNWIRIGILDSDLAGTYQKVGKALKTSSPDKTNTGATDLFATTTEGGGGSGTGTVELTYKEANEETEATNGILEGQNTGEAGGVTITGSNFTFTGTPTTFEAAVSGIGVNDHTYTPSGTISKPAISLTTTQSNAFAKSGITAVTSTFTGTESTVSISGDVTGIVVNDHTYTPAGEVSATVEPHAEQSIVLAGEQTISNHTHTATQSTASSDTFVKAFPTFNGGSFEHPEDTFEQGEDDWDAGVLPTLSTADTSVITTTETNNFNVVSEVEAGDTAEIPTAYTYTDPTFSTDTFIKGFPAFDGGSLDGDTTFITGIDESGSVTTSDKFLTSAVKEVSLDSTTSSEVGSIEYVASVIDAELTGTTEFSVDAISSAELDVSTIDDTDRQAIIEEVGIVSLSNNTGCVTGYNNFNGGSFSQGAKASWAAVVNGHTLSFSFVPNADDSFTAASLGAASTQDVTLTQNESTTKYIKVTTTTADTGTVGISASHETKYMKVATTNTTDDDLSGIDIIYNDPTFNTGTVELNPATIGELTTANAYIGIATSGSITPDSSSIISAIVSLDTTTKTLSPTTIKTVNTWDEGELPSFTQGTDSFTQGTYTFTPASLGNPVTANAIIELPEITISEEGGAKILGENFTCNIPALSHAVSASFEGESAQLEHTITDGSFSGSTSFTPAGSISNEYTAAAIENINIITGAELDGAPIFTGVSTTLSHSVTAEGSVSIEYTPSGSIGGSQTIEAHNHTYTAPASHTHGIALNEKSISATIDVDIATHTHNVTIPGHTHSIEHTHTATTGNGTE